MIESIDLSLVDWSRLQFAVTAIFHWFFVPLTLGLAFIIAFMETRYVRTGDERWKKTTQFWMKLFGINFAIGVATGIILEFEFGTNWSTYSWFVGDIFGAPLAIEGIMAFFMESTFIAIMFFGWDKLSKKVHLMATWLTAFGASLSALWILVANGWMQNPVGMTFNPETARNEMTDFWSVLFNPMAINKFFHTISSSYLLAAVFVLGVCGWYMLKRRHSDTVSRSIRIVSLWGIIMAAVTIITGDTSAKAVTKAQPMKLAAMEGLYEGEYGAGLSVIGILKPHTQAPKAQSEAFYFNIQIPKALSFLGTGNFNSFIPGINDMVNGHSECMSIPEKMQRGRTAIDTFNALHQAKEDGDSVRYQTLLRLFDRSQAEGERFYQESMQYFGYGYFDDPKQAIPNVPLTFYSFRIMVAVGMWFVLLFALALFFQHKQNIERQRWFQYAALWSIPLAYIASQCGWIVAEVGRQPWVIQNLMPTHMAVSNLETSSVQITFFLFLILFGILAIAEIMILTKQIKNGPKE